MVLTTDPSGIGIGSSKRRDQFTLATRHSPCPRADGAAAAAGSTSNRVYGVRPHIFNAWAAQPAASPGTVVGSSSLSSSSSRFWERLVHCFQLCNQAVRLFLPLKRAELDFSYWRSAYFLASIIFDVAAMRKNSTI